MKKYRKLFYKNNKLNYVLIFMLLFGVSLSQVLLSWLLKELMDLAGGGSMEDMKRCLAASLGMVAGTCTVLLVLRTVKNNFMRRAVISYRSAAFHDITSKSVGDLGKNNSSDYISALTNDVTSIESKYLLGEFSIAESLLTAFLSLILMLYYSWTMTLAVLGLCIIPIAVSVIFGSKAAEQEKEISDCNAGFMSMVKDLLSGFGVVKSFQAQNEAGALYGERNRHLEEVKCRRRKTVEMIKIISNMAGAFVQIGVFLLGAYLAVKGQITAGVVVAFVQMMNYILSPISRLPELMADRKAAVKLMDKLAELTEDHRERKSERVDNVGEGIRFEKVSFSYEKDTPGKEALREVSLEFQAGKSYAIVGASGSGKSTLLGLIQGHYEDYGGRLTIGGKEIRNVDSDSIFDVVSVIQQNVFIFDDTIKRNICMFKEFPEETVESASDRAGLKELVAKKGWEYGCGEGGAHLSGGEKQRISIARSLLKKSQVLLVDEATSSLDAETADSVTGAILDIDGITRLVVTHRLDEKVLRRFDAVIVMRGGRAAEQGTFEELMEKKQYFYSLYQISRE